MKIDLLGAAGPRGWPEPGCRCASCGRLRASGDTRRPTLVLVDGVPLEECSRREVPGGYDVRAPGGERILYASGAGTAPEPAPGARYDAALLDLVGRPDHLGRLRNSGAVTSATEVLAVHVDHRIASPAELDRRLGWWLRPRRGPYRSLLLGGARSGKSREAELRLAAHPDVTYVATARVDDADPEWSARIAAHRERRPSWWRTAETADVADVLRGASGAVLVDGLGTWLTAAMDACGGWDTPDAMPDAIGPRIDELVDTWRTTEACVVAVSDEVGLSLVPTSQAGRIFRDLLGRLNQRLAAESEETALVVAGRTLDLS
ncbi:bifunctional adenosylcobinamide kinase/adenosylcobinamide-phosphate guanylyltransferase [Actinomadura sp. HBU206391]|nr:bifunctional adenosylcobinamide kinase/adenosylcobinamide-phosphate guanylyltransferase [Actinomadura sp. HBU206391]